MQVIKNSGWVAIGIAIGLFTPYAGIILAAVVGCFVRS